MKNFRIVLILNNKKINQGFIYHDSLLIANVEKRQKEILFTLVNILCQENCMQYIININEDQILGFSKEIRKMIDEKIILTLSDKDESDKLLGIEVDLGTEI